MVEHHPALSSEKEALGIAALFLGAVMGGDARTVADVLRLSVEALDRRLLALASVTAPSAAEQQERAEVQALRELVIHEGSSPRTRKLIARTLEAPRLFPATFQVMQRGQR